MRSFLEHRVTGEGSFKISRAKHALLLLVKLPRDLLGLVDLDVNLLQDEGFLSPLTTEIAIDIKIHSIKYLVYVQN